MWISLLFCLFSQSCCRMEVYVRLSLEFYWLAIHLFVVLIVVNRRFRFFFNFLLYCCCCISFLLFFADVLHRYSYAHTHRYRFRDKQKFRKNIPPKRFLPSSIECAYPASILIFECDSEKAIIRKQNFVSNTYIYVDTYRKSHVERL